MSRPLALVTGASSGIGADLARELAKDGHDLVLVARSEDRLKSLAAELEGHGAAVTVRAQDLAKPGAAADLAGWLKQQGHAIDVLINNAGFGDAARFVEAEPQRLTDMMQLNMVTLTGLARALAPAMVARGKGRIMNVASTAAFQPGPEMAVYCATKAYVLSLSEALAFELTGSGVTVTCLCPGATHTGFAETAQAGGNALFNAPNVLTSEKVAREGYAAMQRGKRVAVIGTLNKLLAATAGMTPRAIALPLAARLMRV